MLLLCQSLIQCTYISPWPTDSEHIHAPVTCGSKHIKPEDILLGELHTWMQSVRPNTICFDPCREYGCTACIKVLIAAVGGGLPKSVSLPVRSSGVAAQFGPHNVLRALVKHGADTLESLTLRTDAVYSLTTVWSFAKMLTDQKQNHSTFRRHMLALPVGLHICTIMS